MTLQAVLLPLFVQVLLTFVILFVLAGVRLGAARRGEVGADAAINDAAWPLKVRQVSNCFSNQFEMPVLFAVAILVAETAKKADLLFVILAWVFVVSRIVHAVVFCTTNRISYRLTAFMVGVGALLVMWLMTMARVLIVF